MPSVTRILGIDPGLNLTGYAVVDSQTTTLRRVASGVLKVPKGELSERLGFIYTEIGKVIDEHHPTLSAIEKTFLNMNAQSSMLLSHARGAAMCAPATRGLRCLEFSTREIKKTVAGSGAADKEQVAEMVRRLIGEKIDMTPDESDAMAVAICCAHSMTLMAQLPPQKKVGTSATGTARRGATGARSRNAWTEKYGDYDK